MARVLVVDDAAFMRKLLSDALASGGHEVVGEAGNGTEAVARWQELRPELTTLDITMPEKDGLAALAEIISIDPDRTRRDVLGARTGDEGARSRQARRQGLRRQAVPARARARGCRQGARLTRRAPSLIVPGADTLSPAAVRASLRTASARLKKGATRPNSWGTPPSGVTPSMKPHTLFRGAAMSSAVALVNARDALADRSARRGTSTMPSFGQNTPLHLNSTSTAHSASSAGASGSLVRTIVGLAIVIAVIYGLSWIIRHAKASRNPATGSGLEQIASLPLGTGRSVSLVRVGSELHLLGIAEHGVTRIRTFTEDEAFAAGLTSAPARRTAGTRESNDGQGARRAAATDGAMMARSGGQRA